MSQHLTEVMQDLNNHSKITVREELLTKIQGTI